MFDIWGLLAGFGLLIFAMFTIEEALKKLGGNKLRQVLNKQTNTSWKALWSGTWSTALVQSSGLVTLLLLAFVGAGAMGLQNAIGVVIGANIGTTMTSVIVAVLGFGKFSISTFSLPLVAAGGILLIFAKTEKVKSIARFLLGFGLVFVGLEYIKGSMDQLQGIIDFTQYTNLWVMGLAGLALAGVTWSSSSVGVLTLSALDAGIISFPASIAIIMGANIGTSVPGVVASFGGKVVKRHLALAQVLFNVISAGIGILFFRQYIRIVNDLLGFSSNPVMGNAVLNVIFNGSTAILFGFFLAPFTRLVKAIIPTKESDEVTLYIDELDVSSQDKSFTMPRLLALKSDIPKLLRKVYGYNAYLFSFPVEELTADTFDRQKVLENKTTWNKEKHKVSYLETKELIDHMWDYLLPLKAQCSNKKEVELAENLEAILYAALKSIKSFKNIYRDVIDLKSASEEQMEEIYDRYEKHLMEVFRNCGVIMEEKYPTESRELLAETEEQVERFGDELIKELSAINATAHSEFDLDLPTMLNLHHYQQQGSQAFIIMLRLWLTGNLPEPEHRPFAW